MGITNELTPTATQKNKFASKQIITGKPVHRFITVLENVFVRKQNLR